MEKIKGEIEVLQSIYSEDRVVSKEPEDSVAHHEAVECVLRLQPNTGFQLEKVAVIIEAKFTFHKGVRLGPLTL